MPSINRNADVSLYTHRQCVALIRAIYPGGCGFDYKRASVDALRSFLGTVRERYADAYNAACDAFRDERAHAAPAPHVVPAPHAPAILTPPAAVVADAPSPSSVTGAVAAGADIPSHLLAAFAAALASGMKPSDAAAEAFAAPAIMPGARAIVAEVPAPAVPTIEVPAVPAPAAAPVVMEAPAPTIAAPRATPAAYVLDGNVRTISAADAFPSVKWPDGFDAAGCWLTHYGNPEAPTLDDAYAFNADALRVACVCNVNGAITAPLWLFGDKGTGKTEFVRNFAAALGRPFHRIQCDRNLERAEFIGAEGLRAGETLFQEGALLRAVRTPGAVVLFDEPTYLTQGNVSVLNGILEMRADRQYRTVAGDVVTFAEGVTFFAADNTNGTGDATGRFVGSGALNDATLERFAYFVRLAYLNAKTEAKVLRKRTGADRALCDAIAAVLTACRAKAESGHIPTAPSIRNAVAFLRLVAHGVAAPDAFEASVTARCAPEAQEEMRALFVANWPAALSPASAAQPFGTVPDPSDPLAAIVNS